MDASLPKSSGPAKEPQPADESKSDSLDSFDSVMKAMDVELGRIQNKSSKPAPPPPANAKGKGKATEEVEEDEDIEAAMEAELKAALEGADDEENEDAGVDYNLIKNFLESFKSQGGLSGPVGNLAGRLQPGWKLPRDDT